MSFIRTVLGDIPPASLGRCYVHEHVIIDLSFTTHLPELSFLLTDFSARLRATGVSAEALHRVFVTTPASTYSFANLVPAPPS